MKEFLPTGKWHHLGNFGTAWKGDSTRVTQNETRVSGTKGGGR